MDFKVKYIRIHFPDPLPKKKHSKRRLISQHFLKKVSSILCLDGLIQIVTDSKSYQLHIEDVLEHQSLYESVTLFPISYEESTFYAKGLSKGHKIKEYNLKLITPCGPSK